MNSPGFLPSATACLFHRQKDRVNADQTTTPEGESASNGPVEDLTPNPELGSSSLKKSSPDAVLNMLKDVDGMLSRLPAARGSDGPTDGDLSALEEEVRARSILRTTYNTTSAIIKYTGILFFVFFHRGVVLLQSFWGLYSVTHELDFSARDNMRTTSKAIPGGGGISLVEFLEHKGGTHTPTRKMMASDLARIFPQNNRSVLSTLLVVRGKNVWKLTVNFV